MFHEHRDDYVDEDKLGHEDEDDEEDGSDDSADAAVRYTVGRRDTIFPQGVLQHV